jgi:crotonobetainyl-CoA:carnitine CoA-transferase CaiB-like acyl-CoA transferase
MTTDFIFAGLKVVDVASYIAGPAAATVLADFGADVIKVEPPGTGDAQRYLSSVPPSPRASANYSWHLANRNKRGMVLNLKSSRATEILERLAKWADVMITNLPHGTREKLHLGYDEVAQWNPRVIYADVTGFGDAGPDATHPGFDITAFWSRSGLLAMTHDAGTPPTAPVSGSGDYLTAIALYSAIVTALYRRQRTGEGANVGVSLLAAGVWATGSLVAGALAGGEFYGLHDPKAPVNPLNNPYRSADGQWFMLVGSAHSWPGLARALGHPELLTDPRFQSIDDLTTHSVALTHLLESTFGSQHFAYWQTALDREGVVYGAIQTPAQVVNDPQLFVNDIAVPIEGVNDLEYTINSPVNVRGASKVSARRAPELGEHNDVILTELGFSDADIAELRSEGAIPQAAQQESAR